MYRCLQTVDEDEPKDGSSIYNQIIQTDRLNIRIDLVADN